MLALSVAFEGFELVAGWHSQKLQHCSRVQLLQLAQHHVQWFHYVPRLDGVIHNEICKQIERVSSNYKNREVHMSAERKFNVTEKNQPTNGEEKLFDKFHARKSEELVIAMAGPIGCGIGVMADSLEERLRERGYIEVIRIKLSAFLEEAIAEKLVPQWDDENGRSQRYNKYRRLQEAGKELRRATKNPAILAEYAARAIVVDRTKRSVTQSEFAQVEGPVIPHRVAYIIDQVKRPEEVELLRALYRNLFYLVGVTRIHGKRVTALEGELVTQEEVQGLMSIDRSENGKDGQQLDKTLHLADYFLRNDSMTPADKQSKLNRFLNLVHGDKAVTPTHAENGMYAAYSASLRSACLSRQVGAAIATKSGEVIATGCNDVPKPGGGLYSDSPKGKDMRCIHMDGQQCFNDVYKKRLQSEIGEAIDKALSGDKDAPAVLTSIQRTNMLESIYKNTRLKDLIEFSRSVHAEMDAIVSLARIGGAGLEGATLYTTTYPCHNCARHIVASGIMKVFYVEPYEKSLARKLHDDAIAFETEESHDSKPKRVEFMHFEGVAPRQFHNMFRASDRKNSDGKFIPIRMHEADKAMPEYLDSYQDFESKAVLYLESELDKLRGRSIDKTQQAGNVVDII